MQPNVRKTASRYIREKVPPDHLTELSAEADMSVVTVEVPSEEISFLRFTSYRPNEGSFGEIVKRWGSRMSAICYLEDECDAASCLRCT